MTTSAQPKTIVITGASMGLGKAIAHAFVRAGHQVVITARTAQALEEAATELKRIKSDVSVVATVCCDVASEEGRKRLVDSAIAEFGRIDVLINNAGVYGPIGPLEENDEEAWTENLRVNLLAPALLMRRVIPIMRAQRGGKIVNIAGGGAVKPTPTFSAYSAAKAGLVRLTETLAYELKPHNIQVNAIAPGFIASRFHVPVVSDEANVDPQIAAFTRKNMERGGDDPGLAASLCVFMASDSSNHITGRLISAVFDDREALKAPEKFVSEAFYTLRRVDNFFVFEAEKRKP